MITSPYRRGADDGFIFGLYLTLMFFGPILLPGLPLVSLMSLLMMLGVPVVTYLFIRRYDRRMQECATFAMMWMHGVVMFVCGMLIAGALMIIYMKWIQPDFVVNQLNALVEAGKLAPGTVIAESGDIAAQLIKANFIPSPTAIVTELIMAAIVSGSILSIIISAFFTLIHRMKRRRDAAPRP